MDQPAPFHAPPRASRFQMLGPGGLATLGLAVLSGALVAPVLWRLAQVLKGGRGDGAGPSDVVVVLGRRLAGDALSPVFRARLAHGAALFREGLAPRLMVTGGYTGAATLSEAEAGAAWLEAQGLPPEAILREDRSQHTLENLFNLRRMARAEGWSRILLVSDALHLARAKAFAQGLGLSVRCVPARDCPPARGSLGWWTRALSEAFFLHWYHTGMAYSRLIGARRQLERVT